MTLAGQSPLIFVVDWATSWSSIGEVQNAQHALEEATRRVVDRGDRMQCLQSIFLPNDQRWVCVLAAENWAVVRLALAMAQIPERYVRSALDLRDVDGHQVAILERNAT